MAFPPPLIFDEREYYLAEALRAYDDAPFLGCSRSIRRIVDKKKIPDSEIRYMIATKTGYTPSHVSSKRAVLMLSKTWVETNMFKKQAPASDQDTTQGQVITVSDHPNVPAEIQLEEHEKLVYNESVMNIKMVGERHYKKCYFNVGDIARYFEINLYHSIIVPQSGYIEGSHYIRFNREDSHKVNNSPNGLELYLTYTGFVRFLFVSRGGYADQFQEWACETLFAHQFGLFHNVWLWPNN